MSGDNTDQNGGRYPILGGYIVIYREIRGAYSGPSLSPSPTNPSSAKFASQGNVHLRTDSQIKFLYYPLRVNIYIRKLCQMLVLNLTTK